MWRTNHRLTRRRELVAVARTLLLITRVVAECVYIECILNKLSGTTDQQNCILEQNGNRVNASGPRSLAGYNRRFKFPKPGPPRGPAYDPTWGYEPYCEKGDWIFEEKPKYTGDACGQACAPHYLEYGEICGVKRDKHYNLEHKTFKNFCELKNEDCTTLSEVWLIAYRGPCRSPLQTYPTQAMLLQERALQYITAFFSRNPPVKRLTRSTTRHPVQCYITASVSGKPTTKSTSSGKTTLDLSRFYDDDSDTNYNPNYGYEPYWPQGDWVFEEPRDRPQNITTTKIPMVCGEECNYLYRNITKVCAHRADNIIYKGCWWEHCSGNEVDDLTQGFETYDTYCGFLDKQCRTGNETRLVFVHVGECLKAQELWYKPLFEAKQPVSRMKSYLSTLMETFKNLSTTPFG